MSGKGIFNKRIFILITLLFAVSATAYVFIAKYYKNTQKQIYRNEVERLTEEYYFTLDLYTRAADLLFINNIDVPEVKNLFSNALKVGTEEKDAYRNQLLEELSEFYEHIMDYDFRQLHFHEPDNTSFLRFHKPEKYGDDLTDVRYSVDYVNRERKSISGFEEGKIFNGYRNVYPLFSEESYLGSVELSISMDAVLNQLANRLQQESQFIIRKSIVYGKVFEDQLGNYADWDLRDDYMLDLSISRKECILKDWITEGDIGRIRERISRAEESGEGFSDLIGHSDEKMIVSFIPIRNFTDDIAGFIFSVTDDEEIASNRSAFLIISFIFVILLAFFVFFLVYYIVTDKKIRNMVIYDTLTKIYSRMMIFNKLEDELNRYHRYKDPFCICMIDIDHFKRVNDQYGHLAGDSLLAELSMLIRDNIRVSDSIGRYGGDELMILFPGCDREKAFIVMQHIQEKILSWDFKHVGKITISGGIAMSKESLSGCDELIEKADNNLYTAKERGRNRIVF